jgi:hypothetical protein
MGVFPRAAFTGIVDTSEHVKTYLLRVHRAPAGVEGLDCARDKRRASVPRILVHRLKQMDTNPGILVVRTDGSLLY